MGEVHMLLYIVVVDEGETREDGDRAKEKDVVYQKGIGF
jgi:hypothetical protein